MTSRMTQIAALIWLGLAGVAEAQDQQPQGYDLAPTIIPESQDWSAVPIGIVWTTVATDPAQGGQPSLPSPKS